MEGILLKIEDLTFAHDMLSPDIIKEKNMGIKKTAFKYFI